MKLSRIAPGSGLRSEPGRPLDARTHAPPWAFDPWSALLGAQGPPTSLEERDDGLVVTMELPGIDPARLDLHVAPRELTVSIAPEAPAGGPEALEDPPPIADGASQAGVTTVAERLDEPSPRPDPPTGTFRRSLRLPQAVDPESAVASARHGVLRIELRRPETDLPRRIEITAG